MKKIDLSKEKIKYVALGDSFCEGFNSFYGFGYAGYMDENTKKISGSSWASFLARNFQKIDKSILESYYNFGLSGTRSKDWNYFLSVDEKKYNYKKSEKKINFVTELNKEKLNPNSRRLKFLFNNFGKSNKDDFDFLKSRIKEANLITINIGANDILPKFPIDKIIEYILVDKLTNEQLIKEIKTIINSINDDVIAFINKIKELNKDTLIYLVDYVQIQSPFWNLQNEVIKNLNISNEFIDLLMNELNGVLKLIAKKTKIYFISINNREFWKDNNYLLSRAFYDIHPTIFGYKKIAQDVFAKMCFSDSFFVNKKNIKNRIKSFNYQYCLTDSKCFKNGIDFSKIKISNKYLITKVFGLKDELLFKKTSIEQGFDFLEKDLSVENSFSDENDPNDDIINSIKRSLYFIISLTNDIEMDKNNYKDINNLLEKKELRNFIVNNKILSKLSNNIQKNIDNYFKQNNKNISYEEFKKLMINELLDENNVIWFIKNFSTFLSKTKIKDYKEELIKITSVLTLSKKTNNLVVLLLKEIIISLIFKRIDKKEKINESLVNTIVRFILENIDFKKLITILVDFYTNNLDLFTKIKNKNDLYNIVFKINDLISFFNDLIVNVLRTINIDENLVKHIFNFLKIGANKNNINIFITALNSIKSFFLKNKFWTDNISNFIKYIFLNSNEKINLTMLFDFMFSLSKKDFWKKIDEHKINKISQNILENILKMIDVFLSNIKYNGRFFDLLLNLDNPKNYLVKRNFKTMSFIKFANKMKCLKKPFEVLFNILLNNFYISNNKNREHNIYYKSYFRLLTITLFVLRQLFQKNVNKNIFLNKKISICGFVFDVAGFKFGSNKGKDNLVLNMFNEDKNYSLSLNDNKINDNKKERLLYLIYTFDKNNKTKENKIKKIFEAIINGYYE